MSQIPSELKYTSSHEWAREEEDGTVTIGITDHAQALLGDIVFVELPELDIEIGANVEAGVVESVKAASDIYMPLNGTIIAVNDSLHDAPELVNSDPYGEGWIFRIRPDDDDEFKELLASDDYAELVAAEGH